MMSSQILTVLSRETETKYSPVWGDRYAALMDFECALSVNSGFHAEEPALALLTVRKSCTAMNPAMPVEAVTRTCSCLGCICTEFIFP